MEDRVVITLDEKELKTLGLDPNTCTKEDITDALHEKLSTLTACGLTKHGIILVYNALTMLGEEIQDWDCFAKEFLKTELGCSDSEAKAINDEFKISD